jgi:hypothetical protein
VSYLFASPVECAFALDDLIGAEKIAPELNRETQHGNHWHLCAVTQHGGLGGIIDYLKRLFRRYVAQSGEVYSSNHECLYFGPIRSAMGDAAVLGRVRDYIADAQFALLRACPILKFTQRIDIQPRPDRMISGDVMEPEPITEMPDRNCTVDDVVVHCRTVRPCLRNCPPISVGLVKDRGARLEPKGMSVGERVRRRRHG